MSNRSAGSAARHETHAMPAKAAQVARRPIIPTHAPMKCPLNSTHGPATWTSACVGQLYARLYPAQINRTVDHQGWRTARPALVRRSNGGLEKGSDSRELRAFEPPACRTRATGVS